MPLILVHMLWVLAYYLHVSDSGFAYLVNIGLRAVVAVFFLVLGVVVVGDQRAERSLRWVAASVPAFFVVCFVVAIGNFGLDPYLRKAAGQFALNALPAYVVGVYCAANRAGEDLLRGIEQCGLLIAPAAAIYVLRFFIFTDEIYTADLKRLGGIDYMSFAYGLVAFMVASCLLLFDERAARKLLLGRWLLVWTYWLAIVFSQTRGAVLGIAIFLCCLVVAKFRVQKKRVLLLALSCLLIFVVSLQVLPGLFGERNVRFSKEYTKEALSFSGEVATFIGEEEGPLPGAAGQDSKLCRTDRPGCRFLLENQENGVFFDPAKGLCTIDNKEIARQIVIDEALYSSLKEAGCTIKLSRMALIVIATEEIKKRLLLGMGPLAFQVRYFGFHPHSLFVELLAELGLVLGGLIVCAIGYLTYACLRRSKAMEGDHNILLFGSAYIPMFLVSGTIWGDALFSFVIGYIVVFFWRTQQETQSGALGAVQ
ncbi:O-antigen ligase family protein [Accumulibacter sp.]|nr:O-antigen ligase family protein [Accumulibacter sp.]MCM8594236.1 O-antigen ligase family protein [Accumulibacter sp.]MDS4048379.1 O-antigen ligase family protein [Accumulibacter sp.]